MTVRRLSLVQCAGVLFACVFLACSAPASRAPISSSVALPATTPTRAKADGSHAAELALWASAKDTFDRRCVVCHGCYDAPCQLILSSFDGIARGASKTEVYEGSRLSAIDPTRLFIDANNTSAWRQKQFHPVLPESAANDPRLSLLVRMLELKRDNPLAAGDELPNELTLGIDREQQCPTSEQLDGYAKEHALWGMPYGLPALSPQEHATLVAWVEAGAPHAAPEPLSPSLLASVARWEAFFNEGSPKAQLTARYIYEHLFLASLYFEDPEDSSAPRTFFRLVRSRTPSGESIDEIATRRPFESPGAGPFYYRLAPQLATVLAKTHMPYALSDGRLARYRELFSEPDYPVNGLPSYALAVSSNPFITFRELPVRSRYRFMLEEAQFTIGGFIKGPVCRGQVALNVIEDRFWITFVDPESDLLEYEAEYLARISDTIELPAEGGSDAKLVNWLRYARHEKKYIEAKTAFLSQVAGRSGVTLDALWDGDGNNPNAALTVLRHYDSATVVKGFVGAAPETAWVLGYSVLERMHYLLVAGFDVFGNAGHQLNTRMYMDFLRMEAEHNFLTFLPSAQRRKLVDAWYRDVKGSVKAQVAGKVARFEREPAIQYRSESPQLELFAMLQSHLSPVLDRRFGLDQVNDATLRGTLEQLCSIKGKAASHLPETSFIEVHDDAGGTSYFSVSRDSAHTNVAHLFGEADRRRPDEDVLTVTAGFLGTYPNVLFTLHRSELAGFVTAVSELDSDQAYRALKSRFAMRRTKDEFWALSDRLHDAYRALSPLEAGLFDFNRLER